MNKYEKALELILCEETVYEDDIISLGQQLHEESEYIDLVNLACKKAGVIDLIRKKKVDPFYLNCCFQEEGLGKHYDVAVKVFNTALPEQFRITLEEGKIILDWWNSEEYKE